MNKLKIIIACDEQNPVFDHLATYLEEKSHNVTRAGAMVDEASQWHWAVIGAEAAKRVSDGEFDRAILMCWSGTGISMAANKIVGARAALCWDTETAKLARKWNDANILCLSQRFTSQALAEEIVDAFLAGEFDGEGPNQVDKLQD